MIQFRAALYTTYTAALNGTEKDVGGGGGVDGALVAEHVWKFKHII